MKRTDATAEVFLTAFEALPRKERQAVLQRLFQTPALKQDLLDVARWLERQDEQAVPYETVRKDLQKAGRLPHPLRS